MWAYLIRCKIIALEKHDEEMQRNISRDFYRKKFAKKKIDGLHFLHFSVTDTRQIDGPQKIISKKHNESPSSLANLFSFFIKLRNCSW